MATSILHLTVDKGPKKGEIIDRKPGTLIRIGRVINGNTFAIKDPAISQKHLVIKFHPESSRWAVEDLDTSNGTLINDVKIAPSVSFPLSDGDTIKIGESTSISVKIDGAEAEMGKEKNVPDLKGNVGHRRGRSKKAEDSVVDVEKDGIFDLVVEDSINKPKKLGRGRPRRGASRVAEKVEALDVVAEDPVEESKNLRRGRSRRCGESSKISKEDELSDLVLDNTVKYPVEEPKNLRGRPRKGETSKLSKEGEVSNLVVADSTRLKRAPANLEALEVSGKERLDEGGDSGNESKMVGCGEEAEIGGVEEERIVDLEKMTLGEWFDSMEKFLPMAINDVAEEIISSLREKARRFDVFIGEASD